LSLGLWVKMSLDFWLKRSLRAQELELDDPALQADHCGVGTIVGA
jgi:hypothetical protein